MFLSVPFPITEAVTGRKRTFSFDLFCYEESVRLERVYVDWTDE
jgi:hypothetical protein